MIAQLVFPDAYIDAMAEQGIEFERRKTAEELWLEEGRRLWRELFLEIQTESQLHDWESRIPQYDCDCKAFYLTWKSANQPSFPLSFDWKYQLKSAVNKKLQRLNLPLAEAKLYWESQYL